MMLLAVAGTAAAAIIGAIATTAAAVGGLFAALRTGHQVQIVQYQVDGHLTKLEDDLAESLKRQVVQIARADVQTERIDRLLDIIATMTPGRDTPPMPAPLPAQEPPFAPVVEQGTDK